MCECNARCMLRCVLALTMIHLVCSVLSALFVLFIACVLFVLHVLVARFLW